MEYELYHHGILGMHWGIRRFQNKDGSLTAAGRKRYSSEEKYDYDGDDYIPERNKKLVEENAKKTRDLSEKLYKGLSEDKAIDVAVNRLRDQLGGPDQIDDSELLDLVLMEEKQLLDLAGFKSTDDMVSRIEKKFSGSNSINIASKRQQNDYDGNKFVSKNNTSAKEKALRGKLSESQSLIKIYDESAKDRKNEYDEYKKKAASSRSGSLKQKYYNVVAKSAYSDMKEYYSMKASEIRVSKGIEKKIRVLSNKIG